MSGREATHGNPIWREKADFIIGAEIDPAGSDVRTEQLWARKIANSQYEICCIPFFAYDLALGDIVSVDSHYLVNSVVVSSGRYVFRVRFDSEHHADVNDVVLGIVERGALVEWSSPRLIAVDASDEAHASEVADYLASQEDRGRLMYETGISS